MAAVEGASQPTEPLLSSDTHRSVEAQKLLKMLDAAKPSNPDVFVPGVGMPSGGDIPKPQGLYTYALIGPDVWPLESESDLGEIADQLSRLARKHERASLRADSRAENVFRQSWTAGDGASAAEDHYRRERLAHEQLADASRFIGSAFGRLSGHVGSIKCRMRDAHEAAHAEMEASLKANRGQPVGLGPIVTKYRTLISGYGMELHGFVADEVTMLGHEFKLAPPVVGGGAGAHGTQEDSGDQDNHHRAGDSDHGHGQDSEVGGHGLNNDPGGRFVNEPLDRVPLAIHGTLGDPATPKPPKLPQMPSLPQLPSSAGGSSPLSEVTANSGMGSISSLLGRTNPAVSATSGLATSASNAANPAATQGQAISKAVSSAIGSDFGRGLAAGANAAGGIGPAPQPIPHAPTTPLVAPPAAGTTPASAAPASTSVPPPLTGTQTGSPAMPLSAAPPVAPGGGSAPMTPYGSVLPPAPTGDGANAATPASVSSPAPSVTSGPSAASAGPPPSFVPAVRKSTPATISRDVSMTDLESARAAVADLAAASSVVYPGLQWAVVVARGASGMPEMWVTSNEGAGYIPAGVYMPRAMPLAAGMDADFDARWFGWSNPAETVLRLIQARGDAVSAIATTWPQESEMVREACDDVAIGVALSGDPAEGEASTLTRGRSHRLETVDPALYHELQQADQAAVDAYVRQLTQQVVFGDGPELSATAQSIAKALISGRWPTDAEWAALHTEYDWALLMAGSQRPGLTGIEEPTQLLNYQGDFAMCRRMETLMCWEDSSPPDIAYAARAAGVAIPLSSASSSAAL